MAVFLLTCLLVATSARAQLSGTYTISSSGGDYSSFSAAITDLNNKGVSGPVVFNVAAQTFTESITLSPVQNASKTNTITFRGAGRTKTTLTSGGQTIYFNQCSYITFDQMKITTTSTSGQMIYTNNDVGCGIINSIIDAPAYPNATVYEIYSNYATNFTLHNNTISGGYYSYYNWGSGGSSTVGFNTCTNNRFVHNGYMDIYAYYGTGNNYSNNVFDSSLNGYGYCLYSIFETGTTINANKFLATVYYDFIIEYNNYYNVTVNGSQLVYNITNNFFTNFTQYGGELIPLYASAPTVFAHNTINCPSNAYYAILMEPEYCTTSNTQIFCSNIINSASSYQALYLYCYSSGTWPQPFAKFDGNCINKTNGGSFAYVYTGSTSGTFNDFPTYQKFMNTVGFESYGSSMTPPFVNAAKNDLHLDQTKVAPTGVYVNVDKDIDGDARCKLFPTAGADESNYGKNKPSVKFFLPANIFPGSPTYIYQTAKAGEPKVHHWYLNGVKVSDSVVLKTSSFVTGTNCLKLVTISCGGSDSFSSCFTVSAPTAVPGTDFIANKNTIKQGDIVSFTDLSSNGPTKWQWTISPDSALSSGVKVPTTKFVFGSPTYQNPQVQFNFGGDYQVCLTAINGVGKGATVCKNKYIHVIPTVNLKSGTTVIKDPSGYLFDNGGPNNNYSYDNSNNYIESALIDPCADSVYMTFSLFDTYCGYDFVRLYEGKDNTGNPLWGKCTATGYFGGPGWTGGKYWVCTYQCMPNVTKPDTFKAKKSMYLEMDCYEAYQSAGFAAYWWSKPRTSTKPTASFTSSNAGDSVCVNAQLNFTNTTKVDPNDVPTYLWDLDGDLTTFECIGTCATAAYPYFLSGPVKVTLIATNCGGSDTAVRTLTVYNPAKPKAQFTADNTTPTTNDIVYFTSTTVQCVDNFKWSITPSTGTTGSAVYVNGSSNSSQNPQVNFTGTGYYDVKFYVDNASGAQKDSVTLTKYINVRNAYCIPSVATLNQGLGITAVSLNTISNKTTQASTEYSNFVPTMSTTLAIGASYTLTVSRDPSLVFEPAVRTAYIDWNGDGSFVGTGEIYELDSNSYAADAIKKITVPKTAKIGATVMRIAVNRGSYPNKPCGQNEFGEYQDYRIYVTPYNILPVITLTGHQGNKDTIKIEQGYGYTEAGYKATSYLYGDITKSVKVTSRKLGSTNPADSFNNVIPNIYVFSYNVTDSAGNKAVTQTRIVQVTRDKTPPALIVKGPDTTIVEVTKTPMHPVPVPGIVSADDLVDGPLAGSVAVDSGKVQTNIVGDYVVSYTVTDLSGNTAVAYRVIRVIDSIRPVMTLIGPNPMTLEVYNSYTEQGVTITDNYNTAGQLNPRLVITSNLDTSRLGTYTITYNVSDVTGNQAMTVTRTVIVVDTLAPGISLNGNQLDSVAVFNSYNDPGVTVSDNYDKKSDVTLTVTGTFYANFPGGKNPNKLGTYTIIYTATDKSGNKASVTRTVKVQDRTAPVITLKGDAALSVCRWFPYVDAGYTVSDNYDKVSDIAIENQGTFFTNGGTTMTGLLTVRYKATDKSGNVAYTDWRYIEVKSESDFTCLSSIKDNLGLDKYINVYPNPNNGIFTINANLPSQEKIRISVTNMLGQEIAVIHNGVLGQNSFTVDLSNQSAGMYLLNIVSDKQTLTKQIEVAK